MAQVCFVGRGFVHGGVMDCMPELLQFGDQSGYNGSVDLALSEAFVFGSVACACLCVPCVDAYLNGQHLLSFSMDSEYKRQVYYFISMYSIAFHVKKAPREGCLLAFMRLVSVACLVV